MQVQVFLGLSAFVVSDVDGAGQIDKPVAESVISFLVTDVVFDLPEFLVD